MLKHPQDWFDQLTNEQNPPLKHLRKLILTASPNFREELKWDQPCYSINALTCYLSKAKSHVNLGFQQGAHLSDPQNLLIGDGPNMRHIKFKFGETISDDAIRALIQQAINVDAS